MKKLLAFVLVVLSNISFADDKWDEVELKSMKSFTTQSQHYISVGGFSNPHECGNSATVVLLRDDSTNWKMLHADLLAALMADKKVAVRVSHCLNGNYAVVNGVEIFK